MKLLLDTHTFVWSVLNTGRLSSTARDAITSADNTMHVSIASAWEIAIKVGQGKWPEAHGLIHEFEHHVDRAGFELLPISLAHVRTAGLMKSPHRDPFDRLLAEQALTEVLTLVTADTKLVTLGAPCLW